MSDGQFPSESPQDPVNSPQTSSDADNFSEEPGLAPIGASTPGAWPENPDEPVIDLPTGGQFPDDMFGAGDDEAVVSLPGGATSGGLADVGLDYGDGTPDLELPPPAEPQPLTELAIDPIPAPQGDAGGDMFSVDDLIEPEITPMDEAAAPPPLAAPADNGDMFSIDDLSDDEPAGADAGGDLFSVDEFADEPAAEAIEPLSAPAPLAAPEPLAMEPLAAPEPLEAPEPLAAEPIGMEPLSAPEPLAAPAPIMEAPEPLAAPEPFAPVEEPQFVAPEPVVEVPEPAAPVESFAAPADAIPPAPEPEFDMGESVFDLPADEPAAPQLNDREVVFSQPGEEAPPLAGEEIANPYAQESDEAAVIDGASSQIADTPEFEEGDAPAIVNPYATVSDEAQVIDPAMALSQTEGVVEEPEHDVFMRSDPALEQQPVELEADGQAAPNDDQPYYQDFNAGSSYDNAELPATARTDSVAPPGMEGLVIGGLVVADGGKGVKKPAAAPTGKKGKKAKRGSFGRGKKQAELQGEQFVEMGEMPVPTAPPAIDPAAAPYAPAPDQYAPAPPEYAPAPDQYAPAPFEYAQAPAAPAEYAAPAVAAPDAFAQPGESTMLSGKSKQKSFFGIKYGKTEAAPGVPSPAVQAPQSAAKPKSFFGIKYGKPAAAASVDTAAVAAPVAAAAKPKSFFGIKYGKPPVTQAAAPQAPAEYAPAPVEYAPAPTEYAPAPPTQEAAPQQPYLEQQPQAQVIQSAEAAAHNAKQKSFFGIKYGKAPSAPAAPATAAAKPKSFFGIKYGKPAAVEAAAVAAPVAAAAKPKSFFGIKYGKPAATAAPAAPPVAPGFEQQGMVAAPPPVYAPAPVAAPYQDVAAAQQQPVQAVAGAPTAFPGGYPADFARNGAVSPAAATAAAPQQAPEQIMPPVAQTAQTQTAQLQQQPPA